MTTLLLERSFSATHQIRIQGELEEVHGHDFRCQIEVRCADQRDASLLLLPLEPALVELAHTALGAVERDQAGCASAERIAAHLYTRLAAEIAPDRALELAAVTVHEAPGCRAAFSSCGLTAATKACLP